MFFLKRLVVDKFYDVDKNNVCWSGNTSRVNFLNDSVGFGNILVTLGSYWRVVAVTEENLLSLTHCLMPVSLTKNNWDQTKAVILSQWLSFGCGR